MAEKQVYDMSGGSFFLYRVIPGTIAIVIITSPIWAAILGIYEVVLLYLTFVAIYVFYKSAQTAVTNVIGYGRMLTDMKRDWAGDVKALDFNKLPEKETLPKDLSKLYHIIFTPIHTEPYELLRETFSRVANQDYPYKKNIILVAAVEDRAGPEQKKVIQRLKEEFKDKLYDIWDFYHPFGIEGEIVGDACANLRWAGIEASKKLKKVGINSKHTTFTKFDSDTLIHPKFFSALTYKYLIDDHRMHKFYGPAVLTYSNNYWKVPAITRVFFSTLSLGVLNEWVAEKDKKQSFSCYCANMKILEDSDFWDATTGAEDTYFFWNAFLHLDGDFSGEPFYLPVTMDAVEGTNLKVALTSLYKQQLRWGWGVLIMSIALQGMQRNESIKLSNKFTKFAVLFRAYNFFLTSGLLLTLAIPVMALVNKQLEFSSVSYNLPKIISWILAGSFVFQLPTKYYTWKLYGSPPANKSALFKAYWWLIEPLLMFVNLWTYYLIPRVQAIYELTIGKQRKKFIVSIEGRIAEKG